MTKKQFLDGLYHSLLVGMSKEEIYSHIQYYDEYIESEKMKGKSEEEVVGALGSPRLIAKTILDANANGEKYSYESEERSEAARNNTDEKPKSSIWSTVKRILIAIVIAFVVIQLLRFAFVLFFRVILPIMLIVFVYKLIKGLFR